MLAAQSRATEILYGGSAGGGKSFLMRIAAIRWCMEIPNLQVYIFRRIREDLQKNHMEGAQGFRALLAPWERVGYVQMVEDEIRFQNGSKIYLCHCKDEKDRFKYQGAEIHVLMVDELTHFTDVIYRFLRSRVRMAGVEVPEKYAGMFPRILCGSNPGGIGHSWVKATWLDNHHPLEIWTTPPDEGGFVRQFIPARLTDNPSLDEDSYANNLRGLGNDALVKAMLEGDWDVVAGAAYDISRRKHMVRHFDIPQHWTRFMSIDWGYVKPFAVGWFAVCEGGAVISEKGDWPEMFIPDGAIVMYREYYGWNGKPDEGAKMEAPYVAREILRLENGEKMDYRIGDTGMWAKNDGPSVQERMFSEGIRLRQSEKDRSAGYQEICNRLRGEDGVPMFYIMENCHHFWRTFPPLVLDESQPEKGPDTKQEDHCFHPDTEIITWRGICKISEVKDGDFVLTKNGFWPAINLGITSSQTLYEITFEDKNKVYCTGNHPFLTKEGLWIRCDELRRGDILSCVSGLLMKQHKNFAECVSGFVEIILGAARKKQKCKDFIVSCGNTIMGRFLKRCIFIIGTIIAAITRLKIWNVLVPRSIFPIMERFIKTHQRVKNVYRSKFGLCKLRRRNGTKVQKEENGIPSTQKKFTKNLNQKHSSVLSVENISKQCVSVIQNFVRQNAQPVIGEKRILSIIKTERIENVVNLHVPVVNNFCLANGIIVHNCNDMVQYALTSRPMKTTAEQRYMREIKKLRVEANLDKYDPYRVKPLLRKK